MEIQTFEAFSLHDAIKAVKKTLGNDAVIISTSEKKSPLDANKTICQIKAVPSVSHKNISAGFSKSNRPDVDNNNYLKIIEKLDSTLNNFATKSQIESLERAVSDIKLLLFESIADNQNVDDSNTPRYLQETNLQLKLMNIDSSIIIKLNNYLKTKVELAINSKKKEVKNKIKDNLNKYTNELACRWMMRKLKISPKWDLAAGSLNIHTFVGSSGAGKTSVIAKIATKLSNKCKNLLVVSADTSKLAATEQLRLYCKIANINFQTIQSEIEINDLIKKFPKTQMVLVDTGSLDFNNSRTLDRLQNYKNLNFKNSIHLCLNACEQQSQLERTIRSFTEVGIDSLLFTKLDQALSYGPIFNMAYKWGVDLSFFSTGQEIPKNIEWATRDKIIQSILGLSS